MKIYGADLVKWRFGVLVWFDASKYPGVLEGSYPVGFFGLFKQLAIQYDFTVIE